MTTTTDILLSSFTDGRFRSAFQRYFAELGIAVRDWDGLFREMDAEGGNRALLRLTQTGETVGFLMYCLGSLRDSFFAERFGFIREFWVAEPWRGLGNGSALLALAEDQFAASEIRRVLLTTDTAEPFYLARGYARAALTARNRCPVYEKWLESGKPGAPVQREAFIAKGELK